MAKHINACVSLNGLILLFSTGTAALAEGANREFAPGFTFDAFEPIRAFVVTHFTGEALKSNWWMLVSMATLILGALILICALISDIRLRRRLNEFSHAHPVGPNDERTVRLDFFPVQDDPDDFSAFSADTANPAVDTVRMLSDEPPTASGTVRMLSQNRGLKLTILEARPRDHYRRSHVRYLDHALTIGRRLPCDLIIQDENVSGRHLTLTRETDGLYISDNQSTNGTRLNGEVLKTTHPLRSDDIVIIGLTTLKISFEE